MPKTQKITAICFGNTVFKYHVSNKTNDIISFETFIKKKGVKYINYYDYTTKKYLFRKYINKG